MSISALKQKLAAIGQEQVLRFYDQLSEESKKKLTAQLETLDLDYIAKLVKTHVQQKAAIPLPKDIKPAEAYPRVADAKHLQLYLDADKRGHEFLRQGKDAAFVVAGGQGTRLG